MSNQTPNEREAGYAANWLKSFFDQCEVSQFSGLDVPFSIQRSVIGFPYSALWRVRIAWVNNSDDIDVHVSHCPSGEVTLKTVVKNWRDAVPAISDAVKGENF